MSVSSAPGPAGSGSEVTYRGTDTHKFALVVGANNSADSTYRAPLRYAESDAYDIAGTLQYVCKFNQVGPVLVGEKADTMSVRKALATLVARRTSQDFLLFYFSGHAQPMKVRGRDDIYLVTHDFSEEQVEVNPAIHLSMRELREVLYTPAAPGIVALILDCCYAGNIIRAGADPFQIDIRRLVEECLEGETSAQMEADRLRVILTATGYNTPALERNGHGLLTSFLLPALRGEVDEALDDDGDVHMLRLCQYLQSVMPREHFPNLAGEFGRECILASHPERSLARRQQIKTSELQKEVSQNILDELRKLYISIQQTQPFDSSLCFTASRADLDPQHLTRFFEQERVQQEEGFLPGTPLEEQLTRFGFLEQGYPSYGALLCFGRNPQTKVAGATTRCVEWGSATNTDQFLSSREFTGTLLRQFELGRDFLRKSLRLSREIHKEGSSEEWEIPLRVLDEALANALVHREYGKRTDPVRVEVFSDRIEISSPGNLMHPMTLELLGTRHRSYPRNPQIAGIFYLYGYIEKLGTGIARMQRYMKEAGLPEPAFIQGADETFTVVLHRPQPVTSDHSSDQELSPSPSPVWHMSHRRNPYFTGRENILTFLFNRLRLNGTAAVTQPQAISGLGGIGKTQTAIEYAYRHRDDYQYVFWVQADTHEDIISDFITIASRLGLPEKDARDQGSLVTAVQRWLETNGSWLLIFDNADNPAMLQEFLPISNRGHILLTTRAQVMGTLAQGVEIEKMGQEEAMLFLLHRSRILPTNAGLSTAPLAELEAARAIVQELDGLPLALDQAGAYIEETRCGLQAYLDIYARQRTTLLKRRGDGISDHPLSVTGTLSLAFNKVREANRAAADLLYLCAFLAPDAIPEELITEGATVTNRRLQAIADDRIKLNDAISELRKYSLVRRNSSTRTLTIHRLVQAIISDNMPRRARSLWAERAMRTVHRVFPEARFVNWELCQRCIAHAEACAALIKQWNMASPEAAQLLNRAAEYLQARAQYLEAEPLHQQALRIREQALGPDHPDVAQSLNNLARIYDTLGQYAQAEPLYQRALAIRERTLGPDHPDVAQSLNNLALLYLALGQHKQARPLFERALAIDERVLGPTHPDIATDLNNLALLYYSQAEYAKAEPLFKRALSIDERVLGHEHPDVATDLINLASLYEKRQRFNDAEALFQRALSIKRQTLNEEHPDVATSINNLAHLYYEQGAYARAEPLFQQALAIFEKTLEPAHPNVAIVLDQYAQLLRKLNRAEEALKLEERARTIQVKHAQENPA